ncbi:MAG: hypothetical protein AMJ67_11965 [Betaproteobacteria bacterium SG8_41]|nr:MAG: hypothetical protein AMJ67_11965 [Betaproteobacteria bacterium SG8_41]
MADTRENKAEIGSCGLLELLDAIQALAKSDGAAQELDPHEGGTGERVAAQAAGAGDSHP